VPGPSRGFLGGSLRGPLIANSLGGDVAPESNGAVIPRPAPPSRTMSQGTSTDPNGLFLPSPFPLMVKRLNGYCKNTACKAVP